MNNLLIAAKTRKELHQQTLQVLKKLQDHNLYLKPEKCEFEKELIEYLGFLVSFEKIEMDPKKIAGISDWPVPTTLKQLRLFLGFGNYYRKFIKNYSDLTQPLNKLLRKDNKFMWTDERQYAFNELKQRFMTKPCLIMPNQSMPFYVKADASKYATGVVLMQHDSNGQLHPCSFLSQTFSPAEWNYQIYNHELLAVIHALDEW